MSRPWQTWLAFGLCLVVVLSAMGWISTKLVRLDRAETLANLETQRIDTIQVAMWRLESMIGPLMVREASRPYFHYNAFYPAGRAYTNMFASVPANAVLIPSPLLAGTPGHVLVHFQIEPDGRVTSPQVPTGNARDLAESKEHVGLDPKQIARAQSRIDRLAEKLNRDELLTACPIGEVKNSGTAVQMKFGFDYEDISGNGNVVFELQEQQSAQGLVPSKKQQRAQVEQNVRSLYNTVNSAQVYLDNSSNQPVNPLIMNTEVREGMMTPMWLGDSLIAARRVTLEDRDYIQGYLLNWPILKQRMEATVADLFPEAKVVPAADQPLSDETRLLAALPARLDIGEMMEIPVAVSRPTRVMLALAWGCVVVAAVAVGLLLAGALKLSERRAAFVSAVSHELRTPLTTFTLYTDLLSSGKVDDETKRLKYVTVLGREARRLTHLVENVLAYARLERNGTNRRIESVPLPELMDRVSNRLADRAGEAGMAISIEIDPSLNGAKVSADSAAVEQILFNLIDNACKYGQNGEDATIHIEVNHDGKQGCIRVRDHGPGIAKREAGRLFKPFTKSAQDAAHSAPGVGLGLTLSRRLARGMGGDLRVCDRAREGACFILTLPAAEQA